MKLALLAFAFAALTGETDYTPARFLEGDMPGQDPLAICGGEVALQVAVDASGSVESVTTLRSTPPFTETLKRAVAGWRFRAAVAENDSVPSKVLVAAAFRPPCLFDVAGATPPASDIASPSPEVPFPQHMEMPPYPPDAVGSAVVLLEVELDPTGKVTSTRVVRSGNRFDALATSTIKNWRFKHAHRGGLEVPARAYVLFGFREPVVVKR